MKITVDVQIGFEVLRDVNGDDVSGPELEAVAERNHRTIRNRVDVPASSAEPHSVPTKHCYFSSLLCEYPFTDLFVNLIVSSFFDQRD